MPCQDISVHEVFFDQGQAELTVEEIANPAILTFKPTKDFRAEVSVVGAERHSAVCKLQFLLSDAPHVDDWTLLQETQIDQKFVHYKVRQLC